MVLWCRKCNERHGFDILEVERIVYGLQVISDRNLFPSLWCLKSIVDASGTKGGLNRQVSSMVDMRQGVAS